MGVKPIRPDVHITVLKQQYLDYVAQRYDIFIDRSGLQPDALLFVFGDEFGATSVSWLMPNEPQDSPRTGMFLNNLVMRAMEAAVR